MGTWYYHKSQEKAKVAPSNAETCACCWAICLQLACACSTMRGQPLQLHGIGTYLEQTPLDQEPANHRETEGE